MRKVCRLLLGGSSSIQMHYNVCRYVCIVYMYVLSTVHSHIHEPAVVSDVNELCLRQCRKSSHSLFLLTL